MAVKMLTFHPLQTFIGYELAHVASMIWSCWIFWAAKSIGEEVSRWIQCGQMNTQTRLCCMH